MLVKLQRTMQELSWMGVAIYLDIMAANFKTWNAIQDSKSLLITNGIDELFSWYATTWQWEQVLKIWH